MGIPSSTGLRSQVCIAGIHRHLLSSDRVSYVAHTQRMRTLIAHMLARVICRDDLGGRAVCADIRSLKRRSNYCSSVTRMLRTRSCSQHWESRHRDAWDQGARCSINVGPHQALHCVVTGHARVSLLPFLAPVS